MRTSSRMLAAAILVPGSLFSAAYAQTAAPPASGGASAKAAPVLQEVTITAEKRRVSAQRTAISLTAISREDIEKKGISTIEDLANNTPGVTVANAGMIQLINIRGLGLGLVSPITTSGIVNYRDGILITHEPFLIDAYYDLDSIDVLRGPQGTLVGSNSTGGAVFVTSRSPTLDSTNGYIEQTVGNYGDVRTEAAINYPINGELAVRLAGNFESRDSFFKVVPPPYSALGSFGRAPGAFNQAATRLSVLYKPSGDLTFLLKTEYNLYDSTGIPAEPTVYSPYYAYAAHTPFQSDYNSSTSIRQWDWRSILQADWQFSSFAELRTQTAWTQAKNEQSDDTDDSAYYGQTLQFKVPFSTFQQEIDLLSTGKQALQWSAGVFGYADRNSGGSSHFQIVNNGTPQAPFPGPLVISPGGASGAYTVAGFGQTTYQINSLFQAIAGVRYTNDRRDSLTGGVAINPPNGPVIPNHGLEYDDSVTGKLGLNYTPDSTDLVYAFVAKGAKAGGYNMGGPNFKPERVYDYELGWKTSLLDRHLRMQLDGFYDDYHGYQLNVYNPVIEGSGVANAGASTIKGLEAATQALLGNFSIDANAAYVDSRFGPGLLLDSRFTPALPVQLGGKPLPFAPKWTANGGLEYDLETANGSSIRPRVQISYIGSQWDAPAELPGYDFVASHFLVDLRLTDDVSSQWRFEAYVQNLLNKVYVQSIESSSTTNNDIFGNPRTYGVRATYKF